jgi:proteasome lid subunit RPN8/RPN11
MTTKPDFHEIAKTDTKESQFPAAISGEFRIHISEQAYERMKQHASVTADVELCGVLLGEVCRDAQGFFLKISAIIEGEKANNYGAQVTFTHQTWDYIHSIKDRDYPQLRIVGWYHTHPGFGVFLSGMDSFVQENFFNLPYQVAIVIETKKHLEGCFAWVQGASTPLQRYWVGNREVKLAAGETQEFSPEAMTTNSSSLPATGAMFAGSPPLSASGLNWVNLLVLAVVLVCGFLLGKISAVQALRETAVASLESELYSLVEFAGLNALAGQDFNATKEKLGGIEQQLTKGDMAGAAHEVQKLAVQMDALKSIYDKQRSKFRTDLEDLIQRKQTLGDRVEDGLRHQSELDGQVANLYLLRIFDLIQKDGQRVDLAKLSPDKLGLLRQMVEIAVRLSPGVKQQIQQLEPQLLEMLFGNSEKTPADKQ